VVGVGGGGGGVGGGGGGGGKMSGRCAGRVELTPPPGTSTCRLLGVIALLIRF